MGFQLRNVTGKVAGAVAVMALAGSAGCATSGDLSTLQAELAQTRATADQAAVDAAAARDSALAAARQAADAEARAAAAERAAQEAATTAADSAEKTERLYQRTLRK